jgi:hypothetical protein
MNLMVTVSGGRSSAMMARHIQTNEKYAIIKKYLFFVIQEWKDLKLLNF